MQVQSVGPVIPSPDGKLVAYAQTRAVMEPETSQLRTHIFLARADGSDRFQLTQGDKGATSPSFSPDGRYVYFLSKRTGKSNLFRIPVDGGEAERLSDWKGSIGDYMVSPDGKWIAFSARKESKKKKEAKKEKRDWTVVDRDPKNLSLWLIPAEEDEDGKREPKQLVKESYHITGFDWSPDSRFLAFSHQPRAKANAFVKSDIAEVAVETGEVKDLAATPASEDSPRYSPDGRYLAFRRSTVPVRWADDVRLIVLNRADNSLREMPDTYDRQPRLLGWTADSAKLLFTEVKRTKGVIFATPLNGAPEILYQPSRGTVTSARMNRTGSFLGLAREALDEPSEAFVMPVNGGGEPVRVSSANLDLPKLPLGKTEVIRWKSTDGLEIEGLLTYPVGYQEGKRVPFILKIHGGPTGVFVETFLGRRGLYPLAAFAARGWAILRANPRGSSGYGRKFRFANYNDWGGMDYQDLMKGVDHVIEMGVADPDHMAVMGWSYGGYMSSWVITQTNRFKGAVIGAPVTDLVSFTGTSDIPDFLPDYFSGEPWQKPESYRKHSPLTHVENVKTPALILQGGSDIRVPVSQGYEYYHALKRLGVTTKMVVYPRQPHGPREPKFQLDIMKRHLDWIEKYVR